MGEKTPLLNDGTKYFNTSKQQRCWKFQCFLFGLSVCLLVIVLVMLMTRGLPSGEEIVDDNREDVGDNSIRDGSTSPIFLFAWPIQDVNVSTIYTNDENLWNVSKIAGEIALDDRDLVEENQTYLKKQSPSYRHQKVFPTSEKSQKYSRIGYAKDFATKFFFDEKNISESTMVCRKSQKEEIKIVCDDKSKFRSYDGSCNNLIHPESFGVAFRKFRRALPPAYADGVNVPRKATNGDDLPSARAVSNRVHPTIKKDDPDFTVMLTIWGQFIDHDITATTLSRGPNGSSIACCATSSFHPECFPVILQENDPYYKIYNLTCMEFVRSAPAPDPCLGPREQMTQTSAFLDGSVIYGADGNTVDKLRTFEGGLLKMFVTKENRSLLPVSEDPEDGCNREEEMKKGRYCFMTGDSRSNENLLITSMHLIWARNHNKIARELSTVNPDWDEEKIFQESRKIIGAQMQHITFNEFLPLILGKKLMKTAGLSLKREGYFQGYGIDVDPTIANNFATSSFRFAHSLLPSLIKLSASNKSKAEYLKLHEILFDPFKLYNLENLDRNLEGAYQTPVESNDPYFSEQIKEHLFEGIKQKTNNKTCGLDLVSLNIQRGRDHGLPGYVKWRKFCGFEPIKKFEQLKGIVNDVSYEEMRKIYKNVEDIDLYTGALSEYHVEGSILGATFGCLVTDQFVRLKRGDRFWYENSPPEGFTKDQLANIRKTTLATILCDNSDQLTSIPKYVMRNFRKFNNFLPCSKLKRLDFKLWKE